MINLVHSWVLLGLAALPLLALAARRLAQRRRATVRFSDARRLRAAPPSATLRLRGALLYARLIALALLIVAMARPQYGIAERNLQAEGIDIYLVLDCSGSMSSDDFTPNRLVAAKEVLKRFVAGRQTDRIGVIAFATTSFTLVPLTLDYSVIGQFVDRVDFGIVDPKNTAIGEALANAVRKLEDSKAKSKVVILLTDGENNAGQISPELAAQTAKALGVKVYTIGVGSERGRRGSLGLAGFFTTFAAPESGLDEKTLKSIAAETGGMYYRATDEKSLAAIFADIDKQEKTKIEEVQHVNYSEQMAWLVWPALGLLLAEIVLRYTRFARLP